MTLSAKSKYIIDANISDQASLSNGTVSVTFVCNRHSGDGPFLEIDDTIKGFGIRYTNFKPAYQKFTWNDARKTLSITGNSYHFFLAF